MAMAHPELLHLIALFPLVAGLAMLLYGRRRRQAAEALGDAGLVRRLAPGDLTGAPTPRLVLVLLAALLLGIAAVGPVWGVEEAPADGSAGADVVLVLDASNSMRVEDVDPNRLEWQRAAARELLGQIGGSRVGMILFAGRGYVMSPLTSDFSALELYLDELSPELVAQGGSSLSSALEQGVGLLLASEGRAPRALVLMTDGDALEEADEVERAARLAERAGVAVHAVGIGTARGGPVPDFDPRTGERVGFKRDPDTGQPAVSRLGEALLRSVAERTGGSYRALDRPSAPPELAASLRRGGRSAQSASAANGTVPGNRYEWFLALALLLLAADVWVADREGRRLAKMEGRR